MQCPRCDAEIPADAESCPECHAEPADPQADGLSADDEPSTDASAEPESLSEGDDEDARETPTWLGAPRRYVAMLAVCYVLLAVNVAVFGWAAVMLADTPAEVVVWGVALLGLNPFVWLLAILIRGWHRHISEARRQTSARTRMA